MSHNSSSWSSNRWPPVSFYSQGPHQLSLHKAAAVWIGQSRVGLQLAWRNIFAILMDHQHASWLISLGWGPTPLLTPRVGVHVHECDALIVVSIHIVLPPSIRRIVPHQKWTANKSGDSYRSRVYQEYHIISRDGYCGIFFYSEPLIALTIDPDPLGLAPKTEASNLQSLGQTHGHNRWSSPQKYPNLLALCLRTLVYRFLCLAGASPQWGPSTCGRAYLMCSYNACVRAWPAQKIPILYQTVAVRSRSLTRGAISHISRHFSNSFSLSSFERFGFS